MVYPVAVAERPPCVWGARRRGKTSFVGAEEFLPEGVEDLAALRRAAAGCQGCELYRNATATVFGEGPASARLVLVGEQPGDREDLEGAPFVGPAGKLLDRALDEAGIDRGLVYLTNAVKHFKWVAQGGRRLHQKPSAREVAACRPWLQAEIAAVRPRLVLCLGATAAQSLLGPSFRVTAHRGEVIDQADGPLLSATVHPSSILRAPPEQRASDLARFVGDLAAVAPYLAS